MRQTILAKRYAKALFAVGQEEGKSQNYSEALQALGDFLESTPEAMDGLTNLLYPMELREKVMEQLIGAVQADAILTNFLNLLVEKKRAGILPEIAAEFQSLVDADQNISRGKVTAASEITEELQAKVANIVARRKSSQPPGPTCGSVFKNPPGDYAGRLIEEAGLKGAKAGGAEISTVHANFVVNTGTATAADVKELIDLARQAVQGRFGVALELEIELLGNW